MLGFHWQKTTPARTTDTGMYAREIGPQQLYVCRYTPRVYPGSRMYDSIAHAAKGRTDGCTLRCLLPRRCPPVGIARRRLYTEPSPT